MKKSKSDNVFKPLMARGVVDKYKATLLEGHIIKIDGGGHDFVDVIPRADIMEWSLLENVDHGSYCHTSRHPDQFKQAIDELKAEGLSSVAKKIIVNNQTFSN